ncbi:hypothetical protein VaNZ11_008542 [Volvox africanus]|uniref:Uncharacterized protein n=1 Tax=Volvox africanus TaxID=51714 RepID=A0ABQ5S5I0_9CHLO|nr:hypothetical protein VaNZ11_008542 [Volvox africanus]
MQQMPKPISQIIFSGISVHLETWVVQRLPRQRRMSRRPKDPDAFERKVRPIYDALDSRNWKGALKLCQQALQKYSDNELIKVLKAIGLERSGKREEANQVVDEVIALNPIDEQVLRLAAIVLRASGRLSDITQMYENAATAMAPRGGELALVLQHEVFGAHVREQNFVKQQQVALRLSKAAASVAGHAAISSERYGWWVVISILLQARATLRMTATGVPAPAGQVPSVAMGPEKLLALAEGMMARQAAKDGRLEGYDALMVYVDVLLAQGKASDALSLVSGPLGASALRLPAERLQLRAVLSALSGDLPAASELLREGLRLNPDDWGALQLLLDCMLPGTAASVTRGSAPSCPPTFRPQHPLVLISGGLAEQLPPRGLAVTPDEACGTAAVIEAQAVLQELVDLVDLKEQSPSSRGTPGDVGPGAGGGNGYKAMTMRGPDLALVDLAMRRHRAAAAAAAAAATATDSNSSNGSGGGSGDIGDTEAAVIDAVLSYYRKYGSLVSCAVDLRTYVSQLGAGAASRLAEALETEADKATALASAAGESGGAAALTSLRRRVCAAQIRDDLGLPRLERCGEGVELSKELLDLYGTAQPLQAGLDERERGAADELPALAGAALMTAAGLATSDAAAVPYMLAAYGAFADAVRVRPFGAGMRISLAALAALLAAPVAAAAHMYKLDIKHIQLDTLGAQMLLTPLLAWPHAGTVSMADAESSPPPSSPNGDAQGNSQQLLHRALRDTNALFADHACDAGESIFTAYGHGMYTKVLEFTAFRERLAAAHTLAVVRAESGLADCFRSSSSGGGGGNSSSSANAAGADSGGAEAIPAVDAVRSASVAAAGKLNPDNLPTASSLRFNWDLSIRPSWLPPGEAGPSAAVLEWWRSRAAGEICGQGYGRCWWAATGSAEAPSSAAAEWRTCQASAAAHRWLLPHCIAGALGASGGGVLNLREALERLKGLMDEQLVKSSNDASTAGSEADGDSREGGATAGLASCTKIDAEALRRLDVTLYGAALAVRDCLGSGSASAAAVGGAEADAACRALGELVAAVRRLVSLAADELAAAAREAAAWGGVLPGGPLAAVSLLVQEHLSVAAPCIQSWQSVLKAVRKRRAKSGNQMEGAAQHLIDAVTKTAEQLAAAAQDCVDALTAATGAAAAGGEPLPAAAAAAQAVRFLKAQGHAAASVSESAASALEALVQEQRITVGLVMKRAAAVAAALLP